jgi:pimeloyl-ACP methyl ester carboxylesterase
MLCGLLGLLPGLLRTAESPAPASTPLPDAGIERITGARNSSATNPAAWTIEKPANWNGTVLLYAHGYSPVISNAPPESAPREARSVLLSRGYALAASAYSAGGWALAEAPVDQMRVLDEFVRRFGRPRRTIAWGSSMGGMVTLALAERHPRSHRRGAAAVWFGVRLAGHAQHRARRRLCVSHAAGAGLRHPHRGRG